MGETGTRTSEQDGTAEAWVKPARRPAWLAALSPATLAAVAVLAAGVALLITQHALRFFSTWTDENVHTYVARRVSEGAVLYRDIDSARPPLVILPMAGLIRFGLGPLLAARALVLLATLGTALALLLTGRRLFSGRAAVAAAAIYLFSAEVAARLPYTGMQLVQLATVGCLFLALLGRPLAAGLAFGLAIGAGQHSLVIGGAAALWIGLRDWRRVPRFAAGAVASFGAVFGLAALLGAEHLWENLVARHLYHVAGGGGSPSSSELGGQLFAWFMDNAAIFALAVLALVPRAAPEDRRTDRTLPARQALRVLAGATVLHVVVLVGMKGGLFLYVVPIFPLVCLLAGVGLDALIRWGLAARPGRPLATAVALPAVVLIALTLGGWRIAQGRAQTEDKRPYALVPHVRSGQAMALQKMNVARTIARDLASLPADRTLFGHATIVDLVALESGRRVSGEMADLAPRWIRQGTVGRIELTTKVENDGVGALITPRWLLVKDPYFRAYLTRCYQPPTVYPRAQTWEGGGLPDMLVFIRNNLDRPCLPAVKPKTTR